MRVWIGLTVVGLVVLTPASYAGEGASCSFSGGEVEVTLSQDDASARLVRSGAAIMFDEGGDANPAVPCEGATVVNTDLIKVRDTTNDGSTGIAFDLSGGHFEDSGDEIPIRVNLRGGERDTVAVYGSSAEDFLTFGRDGANLQQDSEAEIDFKRLPDVVIGGLFAGEDRACSKGGRGTGSSALYSSVFVGGDDDDVICGGKVRDSLIGAGGNDTIRGYGGGDILYGYGGDDELYGNASSDILRGGGGNDGLDGGPGSDTCRGGPGTNTLSNCEN